jgi:predicted phage terminase large subunit-like protein
MALPLVDRERLLGGNWKITVAGNIFKREWWKFVDKAPEGIFNWCRYWDLAATAPEPGKEPDWTAGVKVGELDGNIYIADCVHFQGSSLTNERTIKATAELDGPAVMVRMEQEGGASGKSLSGDEGHYARNILVGYDFSGVPSSKKKLLRWAPLSAAAEHGRVFIVKGRWNQDFIDELEGCKGEDEKNDQADAASGALEALRIPTGAWSGRDVSLASTGYERQPGETALVDPFETTPEWTAD